MKRKEAGGRQLKAVLEAWYEACVKKLWKYEGETADKRACQ